MQYYNRNYRDVKLKKLNYDQTPLLGLQKADFCVQTDKSA